MTVGFRRSDGTDLDNYLEPLKPGDSKASLTGFRDSNGKDMRDHYAPHTVGAKPGNNTGFRNDAGLDLKDIFCGKGLRLEISFSVTDGVSGENDDTADYSTATGQVQANVSGGTSPYTYSFSVVSGPAQITSVSGDTANMEHTGLEPSSHSTDVKCVVTDANGKTVEGIATWGCSHVL